MKRVLLSLLFLLVASPASAAFCTLSWDDNTEPDLAGYRVYHSLVSQDYVNNVGKESIGNFMSCDDFGIVGDDKTHYFVVRAFDRTGNYSQPSNEVSLFIAAPPPPPPPPPVVCLRYNKQGKCVKYGT